MYYGGAPAFAKSVYTFLLDLAISKHSITCEIAVPTSPYSFFGRTTRTRRSTTPSTWLWNPPAKVDLYYFVTTTTSTMTINLTMLQITRRDCITSRTTCYLVISDELARPRPKLALAANPRFRQTSLSSPLSSAPRPRPVSRVARLLLLLPQQTPRHRGKPSCLPHAPAM